MRCNWHTINYVYLKSYFDKFRYQDNQFIYYPQSFLTPIGIPPPLPTSPSSTTLQEVTNLFFCHYSRFFLQFYSYRFLEWALFCLTSFIQSDHLGNDQWSFNCNRSSVLFYCWVISHCQTIPQFFMHSPVVGHLCCLQFWLVQIKPLGKSVDKSLCEWLHLFLWGKFHEW